MKFQSYSCAICALTLLSIISSAASVVTVGTEDHQAPLQRQQIAEAVDHPVLFSHDIAESQAQLWRRQFPNQQSVATPTIATRRGRSFGVWNGLLLLSINTAQIQIVTATSTATVPCSDNTSPGTVGVSYGIANNITSTSHVSSLSASPISLPENTLDTQSSAPLLCQDATTTVTETEHHHHTVFTTQTATVTDNLARRPQATGFLPEYPQGSSGSGADHFQPVDSFPEDQIAQQLPASTAKPSPPEGNGNRPLPVAQFEYVTEYVTLTAVKVNSVGPEVYQSPVSYIMSPTPSEEESSGDEDESGVTTTTSAVTTLFTTVTGTNVVETAITKSFSTGQSPASRYPQQLDPDPTTIPTVSSFSNAVSSLVNTTERSSVSMSHSAKPTIQIVNIWSSDWSTYPSSSTSVTTETTSQITQIPNTPEPGQAFDSHSPSTYPITTRLKFSTSPVSPTVVSTEPSLSTPSTTATTTSVHISTHTTPHADVVDSMETTNTACEDSVPTNGSRMPHIVISNIARRRRRS
ncbi:hypothetical protein PFICI_00431 [Pestalotiopsis fici W106-1]|uniref:Uncharacterized protein n=1 Tax=Pestalotiopsis fici (strain W106-1 / CGMCC3.15140) TaxID=1229662 RepID=W3XKL6_PESFW|nr:uncharacterized protein PFICI_00431 [Pestalotiopsis fici W106-1]ETS86603.1 hypothetical protein PFICI_00431 [Pestalotiopsis fici W106-1]